MALAQDVSDSSDWLRTPLTALRPVEAALRCQVCKDFYSTPMMTLCAHTFCSLCIRKAFTNDGKCPSCRTPGDAKSLRNNSAVQELVETFQAARPSILRVGQDLLRATEQHLPQRNNKRKLSDRILQEDEVENGTQRNTRSRSRPSPNPVHRCHNKHEEQKTPDDVKDLDFQPDDGLVACPICQKRMREMDINKHLDAHADASLEEPQMLHPDELPLRTSETSLRPRSRKTYPDRLPSLNYSILNESQLRKKLGSLGISTAGSKQFLMRRHTEWANIVNANCDSSNPKSKERLLRDLEMWERSQGGGSASSASGPLSVMSKDFDKEAYKSDHKEDFNELIAQAKQKRRPPTEEERTRGQVDNSVAKSTECIDSIEPAAQVTAKTFRSAAKSSAETPSSTSFVDLTAVDFMDQNG